jgi:peptidyl-prolyl cis-trans isomerase SurA
VFVKRVTCLATRGSPLLARRNFLGSVPGGTNVILAILVAFATLAHTTPASSQNARGAAPSKEIKLVDRIVAVVNSEVLTQFELHDRVQQALRDLNQRGTPLPDREQLERQVLERMITDKVQLQFAKETAVRVDDLQLDRTIGRIAEGNNMSLTDFRKALQQDGVGFDKFREEVRNEIIISRLREREVDARITVSESEIDNYLEDQKETKDTGVEFQMSHILIRVPEQARPDQVDQRRARAEEALNRLRSGGNFPQVAATYSDAPDALQGGDMGWRAQDRLPEIFSSTLMKLKEGEVSDIFRSPAGFHILKLNERRGGGAAAAVEQTRVRHILVRTNEVVSENDAKAKLLQLRERIVNGVDFGQLARQHSDDASSARGGELGWIYPGDTVPDFERAMSALAPMDTSQPVKSPFGWHLIQVLERRTADVGAERKRLEARKTLRDRKSDEAYQEWLRQLRDKAYVEYRYEEK